MHAGAAQDGGASIHNGSSALHPHAVDSSSNAVPSSISLASPKHGAFRTAQSGSTSSANTPAHASVGGCAQNDAQPRHTHQHSSENATLATSPAGDPQSAPLGLSGAPRRSATAQLPSGSACVAATGPQSTSAGTDSSPDVPYTPSNAHGSESVADSVNLPNSAAAAGDAPAASTTISNAPSFHANMVSANNVTVGSNRHSNSSGGSDEGPHARLYDRKNTFSFGKSAYQYTDEPSACLLTPEDVEGSIPGELPQFENTTDEAFSATLAEHSRTPASQSQPMYARSHSAHSIHSTSAHPHVPATLSELSSSSAPSASITETLTLPSDPRPQSTVPAQSPAEHPPSHPHAASAAIASPSSITSSSAPRKSPSFSNLVSFNASYTNVSNMGGQGQTPSLPPNSSAPATPPSTVGALDEVSQTSLTRMDTSASFRTAASGSSSFLNIEQYSSLLTLPRVPSVATNQNTPRSGSATAASAASALNTPHSAAASMHTAQSMQSISSAHQGLQTSSQYSLQQKLYEQPGVRILPPQHMNVVLPHSPEASQLASPEILHDEDVEQTAAERLLADMQLQVCMHGPAAAAQ